MRFKLDENIPASLKPILVQAGHQADTVVDEGLAGRADPEIWDAAQTAQAVLITQDMDFSDVRDHEPGAHAGLILVRLRAPGQFSLLDRLQHVLQTEAVTTWARCFVVVSDRKVRVRKPTRP